MLVYIAAPYTVPDPVTNTRAALRIADALWDADFVPLVPHLSLLWDIVSPKPYDAWLEYDRQLLARCDLVLRVPGDSRGAADEADLASRLGIPVIRPASARPEDCAAAVKSWLERN